MSAETIRSLVDGLVFTVALTLLTSVVALALGILIGALRLSASRLARAFAGAYVEVFRNIPALVLVIFWAYAFPNVFAAEARQGVFFDNRWADVLADLTGVSIPYYALAAALGLTLNTSAYIAELFRAGVGTLARPHWEAARTLGASPSQGFRRLLLPHGLKAASPALVTRLVHHMKNTSLASFVAVPEFFQAVQSSISDSFQAVRMLTLAAVVYVLLSLVWAAVLRRWLMAPVGNSLLASLVPAGAAAEPAERS